jgi:hypothetical protein
MGAMRLQQRQTIAPERVRINGAYLWPPTRLVTSTLGWHSKRPPSLPAEHRVGDIPDRSATFI